jgi:NAD(P)H dehydrogenase (quinone)
VQVLDSAIHLGIMPIMTRELNSKNAPPSNEDIARVAAAVLMDPSPHAGKSYRPTGPELMSQHDMLPLPSWLLCKAARRDGSSAIEQAGLTHYLDDHTDGLFAVQVT